jgi:hypothetical protein
LVPAYFADCAARKSAAQQFIHGSYPARVGTTVLVFAKADGDIEAGLKMLGELRGSPLYIRLLFADDCTLADSASGCNGIAKLLKKLIFTRWLASPSPVVTFE